MQLDAIILSDIHLGSSYCYIEEIGVFLDKIIDGKILTKEVIFNGDTIDSVDFDNFPKSHLKIISKIRQLISLPNIKTTYIEGNHEVSGELLLHILGIKSVQGYTLISNDKKIFITHGNQFDPVWSNLMYYFIYYLYGFFGIKEHFMLEFYKNKVAKTAISFLKRIRRKYNVICCGHTHIVHYLNRKGKYEYYNGGKWNNYLAVIGGKIEFNKFIL